MKYLFIVIFFFLHFFGFTQDTIPTTSTIKRDYKFSVKLDLFRLLNKFHSTQVSFEYRPIKRIAFESEVNYYFYLNYKSNLDVSSNDVSITRLNTKKTNGYISVIAKLYLGPSKKFYLGLKGLVGTTNFDITRRICVQSEKSTSGEVCRCLEIDERKLSFQSPLIGYGPRFGLDIAVWKRLRLDFYMDYFYNYSKPDINFISLEHDSCGKEFRPFNFGGIGRPATDGIIPTLQNSYKKQNGLTHQQSLSFSIKIAYVF